MKNTCKPINTNFKFSCDDTYVSPTVKLIVFKHETLGKRVIRIYGSPSEQEILDMIHAGEEGEPIENYNFIGEAASKLKLD